MAEERIVYTIKNINQTFITGEETINPLKNVSFEIKENTFNIIYGPSGSGKSTLLNTLTGLQKPTSGLVVFRSQNVYDLPPDELAYFRANQVGIVYQANYWVNSLSVLENVSLPLFFSGLSRSQSAKIAAEALERAGMNAYAKKLPHLLSGGEQQRVAMARAIANNPALVVADEPTGSLDSVNGDKIMKLLEDCQKEFGQTVILVTHNMEYLPLADNLLHIQDGVVQQMEHGSIKKATEQLLSDMHGRIQKLIEDKKHVASR